MTELTVLNVLTVLTVLPLLTVLTVSCDYDSIDCDCDCIDSLKSSTPAQIVGIFTQIYQMTQLSIFREIDAHDVSDEQGHAGCLRGNLHHGHLHLVEQELARQHLGILCIAEVSFTTNILFFSILIVAV